MGGDRRVGAWGCFSQAGDGRTAPPPRQVSGGNGGCNSCKYGPGARLAAGERLRIKRAASASSGAGSGHLSHSPRSPDTLAGVKQQLEMVRPGSGMFTVFISLRGTKADLGLQSTNYFVYFDTDLDKA